MIYFAHTLLIVPSRLALQELRATKVELAETQTELSNEKIAHEQTRRQLAQCSTELRISEDTRRSLEEAKQELEDELAETKRQLSACEAERATVGRSTFYLSVMINTYDEELTPDHIEHWVLFGRQNVIFRSHS